MRSIRVSLKCEISTETVRFFKSWRNLILRRKFHRQEDAFRWQTKKEIQVTKWILRVQRRYCQKFNSRNNSSILWTFCSLKKTEGNEPCCREVNRKEKTVYFMPEDYCWMIPGGRSPCKSPEFLCTIVVIIQQQAPEYQHRSWWYIALGEQRDYALDNCCWISRVHKSAKRENFGFFDYCFQEKALSWRQ